jgi:predicted exporter
MEDKENGMVLAAREELKKGSGRGITTIIEAVSLFGIFGCVLAAIGSVFALQFVYCLCFLGGAALNLVCFYVARLVYRANVISEYAVYLANNGPAGGKPSENAKGENVNP